jgi:hypothetical protein
MKRQGAGRVLHFAVTGALLGGVGVGCAGKTKSHPNPGPVELAPNPGPEEDPGTPEETVNTAPVDEPATEPAPEAKHVNPGPQ